MKKKINDMFETFKSSNDKMRIIYLCGSLLAIIYWFLNVFSKGMKSEQIGIFYKRFSDFLADYLNVIGYSAYGDPYHCTAYSSLAEKGYPPLCYVLFRPFANFVDIDEYYKNDYFLSMRNEPLIIFMYCIIVSIIMIALYCIIKNNVSGNSFIKNLTALVFVLSSPVVFTIERGNILLLAMLASVFFVFYYNSENKIIREIALISLGFAFGIKIAPALFGVLLLFNKQYREAIRAAIYGLLFLFVPFLFLKGGFSNIPTMIENMKLLSKTYGNGDGCTLRICLSSLFPHSVTVLWGGSLRFLVVFWLGICCVFCKRIWERATIIALIIMFVPFPSHYYCLIYLIPAAVLFLNEKKHYITDWIALYCFFCIFVLIRFSAFKTFNLIIPQNTYESALMMLCILMMIYGMIPMLTKAIEIASKKMNKPQMLKTNLYKSMLSFVDRYEIKNDNNNRPPIWINIIYSLFFINILTPIGTVISILLVFMFDYFIIASIVQYIIWSIAQKKNKPELLQGKLYAFLIPQYFLRIEKSANKKSSSRKKSQH